MKLTSKQLRQIIKEELNEILYKEDESKITPEETGKIMELLKNAFED